MTPEEVKKLADSVSKFAHAAAWHDHDEGECRLGCNGCRIVVLAEESIRAARADAANDKLEKLAQFFDDSTTYPYDTWTKAQIVALLRSKKEA